MFTGLQLGSEGVRLEQKPEDWAVVYPSRDPEPKPAITKAPTKPWKHREIDPAITTDYGNRFKIGPCLVNIHPLLKL